MIKAPDNDDHRPDDKFDAAMRLVHDWADDCVEAGYTSTISGSHVKMVNAIVVARNLNLRSPIRRAAESLDNMVNLVDKLLFEAVSPVLSFFSHA